MHANISNEKMMQIARENYKNIFKDQNSSLKEEEESESSDEFADNVPQKMPPG